MSLTHKNFCIIFNKILIKIEKHLDNFNDKHDLDYEIINNMLIISLSKENKIIINKQLSSQQIWLSTKDQGYHFNYQNNNWICNKSNKNLWTILSEVFYTYGQDKMNFTCYITKLH